MWQWSALLPHPFDFSSVSVANKTQSNLSQSYTYTCSTKKTVKFFYLLRSLEQLSGVWINQNYARSGYSDLKHNIIISGVWKE